MRGANAKFERRFAYHRGGARRAGASPEEATLAEMDALWDEAKAREKALNACNSSAARPL